MKTAATLSLLLCWMAGLDRAQAATPESATTSSSVQDTATIPARDPAFTLRIATVQAGRAHYAQGNPGLETNFNALASQARAAAKEHPDLIVFPEYAISGWPYPAEAVINGLAEAVPGDGPWFKRYYTLARELRTPLVGWLVETNALAISTCVILARMAHWWTRRCVPHGQASS
ncbi:MAG TPA: nitrilase-related carbon-nitrogen hydrolase [Candidatus Paceibacterota bacterium]|nr:nitrilase-related carbon-nitrogen hydrolase [Verrucomicrobiota bacterium]HRY48369.1 nitrilase-related carbon-nitrogen hydrolase [Candidatus Paceibacterota bacterium]HSA02938.1 nitrilase-related carbon-nitrogen hydrolase [Candidatus Paceibacterota bacterium]